MCRRRAGRVAMVLTGLLVSATAGRAATQARRADAEYRSLATRYLSGDADAAGDLARAASSGAPVRPVPCHGREECEAAAVLSLEAASLLFATEREDRAGALIDASRPLVNRQGASFACDWLLAAGSLHQGYADHDGAFGLYAAALALKPEDPSALLARATALEFSVIPDGFGAIVVADRDVWRLLKPGSNPPSELSSRLANPRAEDPHRRLLLEFLTRQYRNVLELDPARVEARLRLGRVLDARGRRAEAEAELRSVASDPADRFAAAVARLCLARQELSPRRAVAAYRWALEADPALSQAWLGLSQSLRATGDRTGALEALDRALAAEPNPALSAWVDYHLGRGRAFTEALGALRARLTAK